MSNSASIQSPRRGVRLLLMAALLGPAGLALTSVAAASSVYRCESNTGVVEYSNSKPKKFDSDQCKRIDLPELTTIQSPKPAQAPTAPSAPAKASVAESFPSVSAERQRRRDKARRSILQQELDREQSRLAELQEEYRDGEPERRGDERNYQKYLDRVERLRTEISRRESSISALNKEMGTLD